VQQSLLLATEARRPVCYASVTSQPLALGALECLGHAYRSSVRAREPVED
jgi:hypothetical protein